MAYSYKLHELALEEYVVAFEWYENEQQGLGEQFMEAIDKRVKQICENPEFYGYVKGTYRQASVDDFPCTIVYKFFSKRKFIHISAIHHTSRNPRIKFRKETQ